MHHAELVSEQIIDYLSSHGWVRTDSEPDIAVLRKVILDEEEEIVLPRDRSYADYSQRVGEVLQFLAAKENRSQEDILRDVLPLKWDVLRIRIKGDHVGHGTISYLNKGIIEEGVRKILFASARSVFSPKPYFKRLHSQTAESWMKTCRAGASESGSYILSLQLPLEEHLNDSEIPLSRKVTEYLMTSLNQLVELSDHENISLEHIPSLLNSNFCLGLAEMKPDDTPIHFDFEMNWSSTFPVNKNIPKRVEIRDQHFAPIALIGQKLKPQAEIKENLFVGKVISLNGEADEQGNMQGETILMLMDEQQIKAKINLGPEFYSIACDAHKANKHIRVSGVLFEKPRCSDLKDVTLFAPI